MFKQVTLGALVLTFLAIGTVISGQFSAQVNADTTASLSGFAWSSNIGWISLNCANTNSCATSNYAVTVDNATGNMSGFAWSSNIGWINFSPAGPYPTGTGTTGTSGYMSPSNQMTGWARALSYGGGWDGWISLSGTVASGNYGMTMQPDKTFSGFGWGGDVVGWMTLAYASCAECGQAPVPDKILTVNITGAGNVMDNNNYIRCGEGRVVLGQPYTGPQDCTENFGPDTETVTLTATAVTGGTFAGWQGALCTGNTCTVTVDQAKTVTATFNSSQTTRTLNISVVGNGKVVGAGINCGEIDEGTIEDCEQEYAQPTNVPLTATGVNGGTFPATGGWSDPTNPGVSGCGTICVIPVDQSKTVTATFSGGTPPGGPNPAPDKILTVNITGAGNVMDNNNYIRCGEGRVVLGQPYTGPQDCTENFGPDTETVTLTATAVTGGTFAGWQGALCTGNTCTVTVDQAKTVTANFTANTPPEELPLPVTLSGCTGSLNTYCTIALDCNDTSCRNSIAFSDALSVQLPPNQGVTPINIYFSNSNGDPLPRSNFKIQQCTSSSENSCVDFVPGPKDGDFYLRIKENVGLDTSQSAFNSFVTVANGAVDPVKFIFRFLISNAGQN